MMKIGDEVTDISSSSDYDPTEDYLAGSDEGIFPSHSNWDESWDSHSSEGFTTTIDIEDGATRSPGSLIISAYLANIVSLVFLLIGSDILNWIGYVSSGYFAAALIVGYWGIDQQRRMMPNYVFAGHRTFLSILSVLVGLALVVMHSIALSQNVVPA